MRVPARKSCQGLAGKLPVVLFGSGRKKRRNDRSSRPGVPGGSTSYAESEKTTSPARSPCLRHLLKRRAECRLVDARREVEHDDARRARGHERRVAHVRVAGGEEREHERSHERERECDADDRRPPRRPGAAARSRPTGMHAQASTCRSFTRVRIRSVSPVEGDGGDQAATRVSSPSPFGSTTSSSEASASSAARRSAPFSRPATTRRARWRAPARSARAPARAAAADAARATSGGAMWPATRARRPRAAAGSGRERRRRHALRDRRQRRDVAAEGEAVHLRHVLRVDARDRLDRAEPHRAEEPRILRARICVLHLGGLEAERARRAPPGFWIVPSVDVMQARSRQRRRSR